ncbi:MAG: hypothetical protein NW208_00655 [Bryobacter sp.]|nr:hypothetical protein [Bryobacter sp.]
MSGFVRKTPNLSPTENPPRLSGWKEIGAYLGVSDRTARRWESAGLPVHRLFPDQKASVFAHPSEIDEWVRSRSSVSVKKRRSSWQATIIIVTLLVVGLGWLVLHWNRKDELKPIYIANPITLNDSIDYSPALAPDGLRLAFSRQYLDRPGSSIWLMDLTTRSERLLIQDEVTLRGAAWSPDGKTISYFRSVSENIAELVVASTQDGKAKVLARFPHARMLFPRGAASAWLPNGEAILFPTHPNQARDSEWKRVTLATGEVTTWFRVQGRVQTNPAISPDGKKIAFLDRDSAPEKSETTFQLVTLPLGAQAQAAGTPSAHSDAQMSCSSFVWTGNNELLQVLVSARIRTLKRVSLDSKDRNQTIPLAESQISELAFHVPSRRLVYSRISWDLDVRGYPISGQKVLLPGQAYVRTKDNEYALAYHPSDNRIAIASGGRGAAEVFVREAGGNYRQVSNLKADIASETIWQPGREEILHLALVNGKLGLYRIDLAANRVDQLASKVPFTGDLGPHPLPGFVYATVGANDLALVDLRAQTWTSFLPGVLKFSVSPDFRRVYALLRSGAVAEFDLQTRKLIATIEPPKDASPIVDVSVSTRRLWIQTKIEKSRTGLAYMDLHTRKWHAVDFSAPSLFPFLQVKADDSELAVVVFEEFDLDLMEMSPPL